MLTLCFLSILLSRPWPKVVVEVGDQRLSYRVYSLHDQPHTTIPANSEAEMHDPPYVDVWFRERSRLNPA